MSLYMRADGRPALQWWRSVFERRAPVSITAVAAAGGAEIGKGNLAVQIDERLLGAVYAAYEEAAGVVPGGWNEVSGADGLRVSMRGNSRGQLAAQLLDLSGDRVDRRGW